MTFVLQMLETGKSKSPFHLLDPRAKLIWWICMIVVPIIVTNPYILLFFTVVIWIMAYFSKVARQMYQFLIVTYPIMIGFIMLTWPFFYTVSPDQHFLFKWAFLHVSTESLIYAIAMGMRIVLALTACTFFVMTTDLMDLAGAVGEFMQNKLHISYMYPLMVISSFKFLPELSGDFVTITDSFKSRAMNLDSGNFSERLKKNVPVAIPLIDGMLRKAQTIAIALELKAFSASNIQRTFYIEHHFTKKDALIILAGIGSIGLSLLALWLNVAKVEIFL
jgi:energy-coupling factor transport system permease protein